VQCQRVCFQTILVGNRRDVNVFADKCICLKIVRTMDSCDKLNRLVDFSL